MVSSNFGSGYAFECLATYEEEGTFDQAWELPVVVIANGNQIGYMKLKA